MKWCENMRHAVISAVGKSQGGAGAKGGDYKLYNVVKRVMVK